MVANLMEEHAMISPHRTKQFAALLAACALALFAALVAAPATALAATEVELVVNWDDNGDAYGTRPDELLMALTAVAPNSRTAYYNDPAAWNKSGDTWTGKITIADATVPPRVEAAAVGIALMLVTPPR